MKTDSVEDDATSDDAVAFEAMQREMSTLTKGFLAWQRAVEIRAILKDYMALNPGRKHRMEELYLELRRCLRKPADVEAWLAAK